MQFHWSYTGCDESQQAEIAEQWRARQEQLEAKAEMIGGDPSSQVVVAVEHADTAPAWWIQVALYAPEGSSVAEAEASEMIDAMDRVIGELSQRIDQQTDRAQTIAQRRQGMKGFLPILQAYHRDGKSRDFISLLTPVALSLSRYIGRELRDRRTLGEIPAGQVNAREVMDDILLKAWEQFDQRPPQQPLDIWLIRLIDKTLETLGHPAAEQSLDDRVPVDQMDRATSRESQEFESVEQPTEFDSIALERLIPGRSDAEPWDGMDVETKQVRLQGMLHRLPRRQRNALMLQAVEGYSEEEIADLQSRPLAEVLADLDAARQQVRRMFADDRYPELQERLEREALQRPRRSHRT